MNIESILNLLIVLWAQNFATGGAKVFAQKVVVTASAVEAALAATATPPPSNLGTGGP